ncbi:hypothetical protein [Xanthomonas sp. A1809]|uniref:hypothetical protein n=1 Tax=Xanthomonas sp. A1809 TaxID=2821275 RepID=UPI001ADBF7AD|nr:hypothetical protein [Xanthomonas sp. A1809]MBO9859282.1 hypothetical protein [Xanthomonas sp. A1809]
MSSNRETSNPLELPDNMATRMYPLQELASIIADQCELSAGKYALVVEYKLGNSIIQSEAEEGQKESFPAMSIGIGGIGLRATSSDGKLTIDYPGKAKKRSIKKARSAP